ncbi:MAG: lytic transglycosylase domain-containing protein, partial [Rhodospirillaceae bacterium]
LDPASRYYDAALYPLPAWELENGYSVDRALVFAFIRQESRFNTNAKSPAGARGLMQLMPRTASFVAKDNSLRGGRLNELYNPQLNLDLGQRYLELLMGDDLVRGNLFMLAAAYNGGPGNLNKWLRRMNYPEDPLLFIESIPSRETRLFIERVLSNFWLYRLRLGQEVPSLDAVAAGRWPYYFALDGANPLKGLSGKSDSAVSEVNYIAD